MTSAWRWRLIPDRISRLYPDMALYRLRFAVWVAGNVVAVGEDGIPDCYDTAPKPPLVALWDFETKRWSKVETPDWVDARGLYAVRAVRDNVVFVSARHAQHFKDQRPQERRNDRFAVSYSPRTRLWRRLPVENCPGSGASVVFDHDGQRELVVWGGDVFPGTVPGLHDYPAVGARFDFARGTWQPTSTIDAPRGRSFHELVWTGTEVMTFGGYRVNEQYLAGQSRQLHTEIADGAAWNAAHDRWRKLPSASAPSPRFSHVMAWTGDALIVWGGRDSRERPIGDGAMYFPATDEWRPMSRVGAPTPRYDCASCWTGSVLVVWGGHETEIVDSTPSPVPLDDGAAYEPRLDRWTPLPAAPGARGEAITIWTGTRMLMLGGVSPDEHDTHTCGDAWILEPPR